VKEKNTPSFYDFSVTSIKGETIDLDKFMGKVILVVNTASKCGYTPQYEGLEELFQKYKDDGFVVLGFPCNQFGNQESGDEDEIQEFCQVNYGVSFPMFAKIDVNGSKTHPLFVYLKKQLGGFLGSRIKWNFTKFLIDRNGKPFKRYAPIVAPDKLEPEIKQLLQECMDTVRIA